MKKVISIKVQNVPGVLSHIAGLLASRAYNVDSLTVGRTVDSRFSRMTVVVDVDPNKVEQVERQLQKLVTVVKTTNLSNIPHVERELALVRVAADAGERTGVLQLVQIFRGSVIDVAPKSLLVELTGNGNKLDAFLDALKPYKIISLTRSGCIAAPRGDHELERL